MLEVFTLKHPSFEHRIHTLVYMHSVLKGICVNTCIRCEGLWRGSRGELKDSNLFCLVSEPITCIACYIVYCLIYGNLLWADMRYVEILKLVVAHYLIMWYWVNLYMIFNQVLIMKFRTQYMNFGKCYWAILCIRSAFDFIWLKRNGMANLFRYMQFYWKY